MEGLEFTKHTGPFAAEGLSLWHVEGGHLADVGTGNETLLTVASDNKAAVFITIEIG